VIGNIVKGSHFGACTAYLLSKSGASIVAQNTISSDIDGITKEFEVGHRLAPHTKDPAFHVSFSIPEGERLPAADWGKVADRYVRSMQLENHQYIAVRHTDRPHDHMHMLISRINLDRKVNHLSFSKRRTETFIRQVEMDFGLQVVPCSWEINRKEEQPRKHYELGSMTDTAALCASIDSAAVHAMNFDQFQENLACLAIELRERKSKEGKTIGLSYRFGEHAIAGHKLGKTYMARGILERFDDLQEAKISSEVLDLETLLERAGKETDSRDFSGVPEKIEISPTPRVRVIFDTSLKNLAFQLFW
jgi:Relaxase/Mobilisation nuclease domain